MEIVESIGVRVLPEMKGFRQKLEAELKKIDTKLVVDIELGKLDTTKAKAQLTEFREKIEAKQFSLQAKIDLDTKTADARLAAFDKVAKDTTRSTDGLGGSLKDLQKHFGNTGTRVQDVGRRLSGLSAIFGSMLGLVTRLSGGLAKIGASTLKFAAIAAAAAGAAAAVGHLVTALAGLLPLVGLLPGVAIAGVSAIAALKIGMKGFSDTLKAMEDPEKFAEALKKLSPSAKLAALAIRDLKPAFEDMQLAVQERLFHNLGNEIKKTADDVLPHLKSGLAGIAGEFSRMGQAALQFAREQSTLDDLDIVFKSTEGAMANFRDGLKPILRGLTDIGTVAASMLPELTRGFGDAARSFEGWAANIRETGQLEDAINGAIQKFKDLFAIIGNVAGILSTVFGAAGDQGIDFLKTLRDITANVRDFLQSSEGAGVLSQVFEGLSTILGGVGALITSVAKEIGAVIGPVIQALGPLLAEAFRSLIPAVQPFIHLLQTIAPLVATVARVFAVTLAAAIEAIAPVIERLIPPIDKIVRIFGDLLVNSLDTIVPLLDLVVKAFADIADSGFLGDIFKSLLGVLKGVLPFLLEIGRVVATVIGPALAVLGPALGLAFNALLPAIEPLGRALAAMAPLIGTLAYQFASVLGAAIVALAPVLIALVPPVTKLIEFIGKELVGAIVAVAPILLELARILAEVFLTVLKDLEPILPVFIKAMADMGILFAGALKDALPTIVDIADKLGKAFLDALIGIIPLLPDLVQAFVDILAAIIPLLPEITKLAVSVLPEIVKILPVLLPLLLDLTKMWVDLVKELTPFVKTLVDDLIPAIGHVGDVVIALLTPFKDVFKGIGDLIGGFVKIVKGFLTGDLGLIFEGSIQQIKGFFELFRGAVDVGVAIVMAPFEAFFGSVKDMFTEKPKEWANLVKDFFTNLPNNIGDVSSTLFRAGLSLIGGFINGIRQKFAEIPAIISGGLSSLLDYFPHSPAKKGPLSGHGYTLYSGRALAEDFAKGITERSDLSILAIQDMMAGAAEPLADLPQFQGAMDTAVDHSLTVATGSASSGVAEAVREGLAGSTFEIDQDGVFKVTAAGGLDFARK